MQMDSMLMVCNITRSSAQMCVFKPHCKCLNGTKLMNNAKKGLKQCTERHINKLAEKKES